jgi:hypothetical protein
METTLYSRQGTSNKFYTVKLEEREGLWFLSGISGPIGGTAKTQIKLGGKGVDYATGLKAYNSLIREKLTGGSGYEVGDAAAPLHVAADAPTSASNLPTHMLLIDMEKGDLKRLVNDPQWIFELKHDGHRCRITVEDGVVTAMSRQNLSMSLPKGVVERIKGTNGVFDGELVKDVYYAFDILMHNDVELWREPATVRADYLLKLFPITQSAVVGTDYADTPEAKQHLHDWAHEHGFEGIVAKKNIAYAPSKSGFALRLKFRKSASVICVGQHGDKSSFDMALFDGSRRGSCTVYPNQTMPAPNEICEIEFLYLHDVGGNIIQPVFKGVRFDVNAEDCTIDQFQVKGKKR